MDHRKSLLKPIIKNKPIKRRIVVLLVLLVLAALIIVTAWGLPITEQEFGQADNIHTDDLEQGEETEIEPYEPPTITTRPRPEPIPNLDETSLNPLTGLPIDEKKVHSRPLAIALGNTNDGALPLNGISDADIVYEVPVEGGLTRFLAIYQDFAEVKMAGSVRSARHYTAQIARSYDAILASVGASPMGAGEIRNLGVTHLNEVSGYNREVFRRDHNRVSGRRVGSVHATVILGERVAEYLPQYNFRLEHEDGFELGLVFSDDVTISGGSNANTITARFSAGKTTTFIYDAEKKLYFVHQYGMGLIDANDNSRAGFTNVLILKTSVTGIPGDSEGRQNVVTIGEGEGYFASGGEYVEIIWSRADMESPFVYMLRDGTVLELGRGRTFICVVPTNMSAAFE